MKTSITLFIILLTAIACNTPKDNNTSIDTSEPISEVEKAIDKAVAGAYDFWKFEKGVEVDFSNFNDYYTPNSFVQTMRGDSLEIESMKEGLERFKKAIDAGQITYFSEFEIDSKTEYYGNIAHRISYHAYYFNSKDSIYSRAVNSLQIVNIDGKWLLYSVLRQFEDDDFPFPSKYDNMKK